MTLRALEELHLMRFCIEYNLKNEGSLERKVIQRLRGCFKSEEPDVFMLYITDGSGIDVVNRINSITIKTMFDDFRSHKTIKKISN
jgi:hypothetical protein